MKEKQVSSQLELDRAIEHGFIPICTGSKKFIVRDSSQVIAYDSSQVIAFDASQVTAFDSSQVIAYGSSQVTAYTSSQVIAFDSSQVIAYDSSQVRCCNSSQVMAYDSSQVKAYGSSQVMAYDSSQITASKFVAVTTHSLACKILGGKIIKIVQPKTATQWLLFYGVKINKGVAVLFKAVSEDFRSKHNYNYSPGITPVAPDWDGGKNECGGGLHFSPKPFMALDFFNDAKRFVACPVKVKDIVFHAHAQYPQKIKAKGCCAPVWECDINGSPIKK